MLSARGGHAPAALQLGFVRCFGRSPVCECLKSASIPSNGHRSSEFEHARCKNSQALTRLLAAVDPAFLRIFYVLSGMFKLLILQPVCCKEQAQF